MFKINNATMIKTNKFYKLINNLFFVQIQHVRHKITFTEKQYQKQILQDKLGLSYQRSAALFRKYPILQSIEHNRLEDTINSLNAMGINNDEIYKNPMTLTLHSNTIEHNMKYLQEVGFIDISAQVLLKFRSVVKKPVILLKAYGIIPENVDVPKKLITYLSPTTIDLNILEKLSEEDSIIYIHEMIFKHYLVWRMESSIEEVNRIFKIYDNFKYKSFELISQMIQLLTEELGFSNRKLLQHGYLFQTNPIFVKTTMKNFPKLAGVDIKSVLYRFPKIISAPPDNIVKINNYLKNYGVSEEAIRKCFDIYTLAPDTVLYRLDEQKKIPEFEALSKNSRMVRLILCQNKAKLRLDHLKKLKMKCASINILLASDLVFEKYVQDGSDRTKGIDLANFISQELGITEKQVRIQLSNNPHWCNIPLTVVKESFLYLIDCNLSRADIAYLPNILLYPRKYIQYGFKEIETNPDTKHLKLNPKLKLNLCLYFMEKQYHFSGNGLWENYTTEVN